MKNWFALLVRFFGLNFSAKFMPIRKMIYRFQLQTNLVKNEIIQLVSKFIFFNEVCLRTCLFVNVIECKNDENFESDRF